LNFYYRFNKKIIDFIPQNLQLISNFASLKISTSILPLVKEAGNENKLLTIKQPTNYLFFKKG